MRWLHRYADARLREENGHLRSALRKALRLIRSMRDQRDSYRADVDRWRSIAHQRAQEIEALRARQGEMK